MVHGPEQPVGPKLTTIGAAGLSKVRVHVMEEMVLSFAKSPFVQNFPPDVILAYPPEITTGSTFNPVFAFNGLGMVR
jgi:hypothetical protein